ncbi:hypothetical protein [Curtobacterium sp. VKM Ac-2922]|uniref:hypothetical protein n=1 Tax=Curtobacterium sp. VKM Ac-2922 TaxID=2929475 RepID=UPI001FB54344|nr:hypothetical protein [Curtobacterium sp. VKM Ac-2922]MCJ1713047.1 hypothetical protein [Curtobacterium sp. VKM Ac-2922]
MDLREAAIRNNVTWCATVAGAPGTIDDANGFWLLDTAPPPLFPDLVTLRPGVAPDDVAQALTGRDRCSVKDSFADVDMTAHGFAVAFEAQWIGRAPRSSGSVSRGWFVARDAEQLASWNRASGLPSPLPDHLLDDAGTAVVVFGSADRITAGAVVTRGADVAGLSNVFDHGDQVTTSTWRDLLAVADLLCPGLPVVDYEHGVDLATALAAGLRTTGPLRVWVRPH